MPVYNDEIHAFITETFAKEDGPARSARLDSPGLGLPEISINAEEGRFLMLLAAAAKARLAVEIGTLGGYSGIWIARGLSQGGKLITIDVNPHHSKVAAGHFAAAGLADRVELLTGDASSELRNISPRAPFDFVFIDADKEGYPEYFEWAVQNVRTGGLIAAHNAFRGGRIVQSNSGEPEIMRKFLEKTAMDPRVISTIYPGGDGTLVAVKTT